MVHHHHKACYALEGDCVFNEGGNLNQMEYSSSSSSSPSRSSVGGIQEKIALAYYRHGLFCSSHPYAVILVTLLILAFCCFPLLHLPFLGSSSQQFTTPFLEYTVPEQSPDPDNSNVKGPRWFQGPPVGYVQQIVVRSAVSPWQQNLILTDAFRAPLAEAFHVMEIVRNYYFSFGVDNTTAMNDICLQVSEPVDKIATSSLPHYSCLIVSPTHIWKQDVNRFHEDGNIIKTIFDQRDSTSDVSSLRESLFGVPWRETGIKKMYIRNRPRILTYAVTVILEKFDQRFISNLHKQLCHRYPVSPYPENSSHTQGEGTIAHIHFQDQHTLAEFVPLGVTYIILFLYIYFSVRKIDLVKSKWALAVSAVMTVVMSLLMSVGLCLWFGLNPTLNGSEILPYLVVVIGLENMLVLTKSVVSTPVHLDVKLRVAQGLSKEGWSITKNLLTELALLTFAYFTFVPAIQEFCLFAVVGLLSDFFLQLVFFATVLSIDIRRMELGDLHKGNLQRTVNQHHQHISLTNKRASLRSDLYNSSLNGPGTGVTKSLSGTPYNSTHYSARVFALPTTPILVKLPKRMKFIYFWARTRMVQRGLMVCLVVWIILLVYKSGIVEKLTDNTTSFAPAIAEQVVRPILLTLTGSSNTSFNVDPLTKNLGDLDDLQQKGEFGMASGKISNIKLRLKHHTLDLWQSLPPQHWTTLFGYYNISLSGRYISILPPIPLSISIDPNVAIQLRHPNDKDSSKQSQWKFLKSGDLEENDMDDLLTSETAYHPSSPAEVALTVALSIPSILFLVYFMVVLYRCMCSRHYAEWRSSWWRQQPKSTTQGNGSYLDTDSDACLIMDSVPVKLHSHTQELENIVAEDNIIVSSCMAGDICIWDSVSGDCLSVIRRSRSAPGKAETLNCVRGSGSFSSDSTYGSSPPSDNLENCIQNSSPLMPSSFKNLSGNATSNSKQTGFSSDESSTYKIETNSSKGYDFSRFYSLPETQQDDISQVKTRDRDSQSGREAHEYQQRRDACDNRDQEPGCNTYIHYSSLSFQPIWCLDCQQNWIAVGCQGGRLELWEGYTGSLKYVYEESKSGITAVCLHGNRIIIARLNGVLEFFLLEVPNKLCREDNDGKNIDCSLTEKISPAVNTESSESEDNFQCLWMNSARAHNQPVTALAAAGGHIVTGGQDRLVKVFCCDTAMCVYTLHGHSGTVSALHIDQIAPTSAASGCQDGLVCVWDLLTGACVFSLAAHQGTVLTLASTNMYLISQGADDQICIWEKCQGHLLHCIHQDDSICCNMLLLTSSILVTAKEDHLVLWDVNHGEAIRMVMVGSGEQGVHIKQLRLSGQAIVCDYGYQMFIINFPAITEKGD